MSTVVFIISQKLFTKKPLVCTNNRIIINLLDTMRRMVYKAYGHYFGGIDMEKREQLYEGKAKKVFLTDDPEMLIVSYKDDATAFNGLKKGTITGKGVINNRMSNLLMQKLEKAGVPTHFVEELNDRETVVKKVSIVPLEVIIRNIAAGSFSKNYGVEEGVVFDRPTIEFSYKNDDLGGVEDAYAEIMGRLS